ncbi:hypothetical protein [Paucibacter soli]|uniref:hypothetical protein n=1 Tax=Paucibacter soli TaxID=3133433 RepID=UPI0030A26243
MHENQKMAVEALFQKISATWVLIGLLAFAVFMAMWLNNPAPTVPSAKDGETGIEPAVAAQSRSSSPGPARAGGNAPVAPVRHEASIPGQSAASLSSAFKSMPGDTFTFQRAARQGYGSFIAMALASRDPSESLRAARLLKRCRGIAHEVEIHRAGLHEQTESRTGNETALSTLGVQEEIQRHCQAISVEQQGREPELLEVAARGGVLGGASDYYQETALGKPADPERTPWLVDSLARDAKRGDIGAMKALACDKVGIDLPLEQRQTFLAALKVAASRQGHVGSYARMYLSFCKLGGGEDAAVDAKALQRLVAAIDSVGISYTGRD